MTLSQPASRLLASQLPILKHFGFDVEEFGPNTFQVRAMPALFAGSDPVAALRVVVEDFEEDEVPLQNEVEKKLAARVCKRLAVKAGQVLSADEQRALLTDLESCESPRTCPHGRPTMIHLSVETLERQFGRQRARRQGGGNEAEGDAGRRHAVSTASSGPCRCTATPPAHRTR